MTKNRLMQDEHEKYFFGYSSSEVYSFLENSLIKSINGVIKLSKDAFMEQNVCSDIERIDKDFSELESFYISKCGPVLMEFKSVLRDIFNIPENACIYKEPPKTKYTEDDIKALEKEVFDLTQKYLTEKKIIAHAKKEKQILEQLKPTFQLTKMTLESLENDTNSTEPKKEKIQKFEEKLEEFEKLNCVKIDNSLSLEEDLG